MDTKVKWVRLAAKLGLVDMKVKQFTLVTELGFVDTNDLWFNSSELTRTHQTQD